MSINYAPTPPAAGASRATKEVELWTDLSDTLPDVDTRLDTLEAAVDSDDQTAAQVPISDAGGYYTGTDVEAALQEVGADLATVSTLITVDNVAATTYTVVSGDAGKVKRFTAAGAVTVTLPTGIAVGTLVELLFVGAAGGSVAAGSGATVNGAGAVTQHKSASALCTATSTWNVQGAS